MLFLLEAQKGQLPTFTQKGRLPRKELPGPFCTNNIFNISRL